MTARYFVLVTCGTLNVSHVVKLRHEDDGEISVSTPCFQTQTYSNDRGRVQRPCAGTSTQHLDENACGDSVAGSP